MSHIRKTIISKCEKKFLIKSLSEHTRLDGRSFDEFRDLDIKFGHEWGSCYLSLGQTKVLAQVSCEVQVPKSSRPSEGVLYINVELNPMAAPHFEANRPSNLSVQFNRLLEKCLKDSRAVDLESLCIKMNEKVWAIRVDINVMNHEGNILDCASMAALAALTHFRRPDVTCDGEEFIIHNHKQRDPIPLVMLQHPVCVTYSIFEAVEAVLADPNLLEEGVADAYLTVGANAYRELCGLHLGGKANISPHVIMNTTKKAITRAGIVIDLIKQAVEEDVKLRQERLERGFHKTVEEIRDSEIALTELKQTLDVWMEESKQKKKKRKAKQKSKGKFTAEIEDIGAGTAALVPTKEDGQNVWEISESEDESEVVYLEPPKVEPVEITDTGSEEETVVILNANKKTNKGKTKK